MSGEHSITSRNIRLILNIAILALFVFSWLYGYLKSESDIKSLLQNVLPQAEYFKPKNSIFIGFDTDGNVAGYAASAESIGYGGPVCILVGIGSTGIITGVQVVEQHETPDFYHRLRENGFTLQFLGKEIRDFNKLKPNIDGVSGATLSSTAIAMAIQQAVHKVNNSELPSDARPVNFGLPEISLFVLFITSWSLPRLRDFPIKKAIRWGIMLISMVVLGFILNKPLTIANITSFFAGFWPDFDTNLYWYLMLGGVLGIPLLDGKNIYCATVCPFGVVQECLGQLGGVKPYRPRTPYRYLRWVPRGLAVLTITLGLAFRQPAAASYEPFADLFGFARGFNTWFLLVLVLLTSVVMLRPFCIYLCPVKPVIEFILYSRGRVKRIWQKNATLKPKKFDNLH